MPDTHQPELNPGPAGPENARPAQAQFQPALVASLVAAIILAIAIGAFWGTF